MANQYLKETVLQVLENQLKENNPPITKITYERLLSAGNSEKQAKEKIAAVLLGEIYDVMKSNEPFDEERYTNNLNSIGG